MLSSTALFVLSAAAAPAAPANSPMAFLLQMLPMIAIFAIFYFLFIRPQSRRVKEHRQMIDAIAAGNEVVFASGLMGRVKKIQGDYAVIAMNANQEVMVQRASIMSVLPAGTIDSLKDNVK